MDHKRKIHSTSKAFHIVILFLTLLISAATLYTLVLGIRINLVYSSLSESALKIRLNTSKAKIIFYDNYKALHKDSLNEAWQYFEMSELLVNNMLNQKLGSSLFFLPAFKKQSDRANEQLKALLEQFKEFSANRIEMSKSPEILAASEEKYGRIELQIEHILSELQLSIVEEEKSFRLTQMLLIGSTLTLAAVVIFVFSRSERQRANQQKQIKELNHQLEKSSYRRDRAEQTILESERKLKTLLSNLPGIAYRRKNDDSWTMEYISEKCLALTGLKPEDLLQNKNASYSSIIHPDDKIKMEETVQRAVEERKPYQLVYRIKIAGGYERWMWEQGVGVFSDEDDELEALEGFISDITDQKAVEEQLSLQSTALEAAANGIIILDKERRILWVNTAFTMLTGYLFNEIAGQSIDILKSRQHPEEMYEYIWSKVEAGELWRGEWIAKRKDDTIYYEELTITPIRDSRSSVVGSVVIQQDVTDRKNSEDALRESEKRFRGLYENSTIGIYRTSAEGKVLLANPTLVKLLGFSSFDELQMININHTYVDIEQRQLFIRELEKKGRVAGFESDLRTYDGRRIFVRESARAIKDELGKIVYYEGTVEDVTDKKEVEKALVAAKEKAEQSDKMKSEFLAQMSHEIRTPLNVILSFNDFLKDELHDKIDEDLRGELKAVDVEGKRIMRTVELILNMSELQTGSYNFTPSKFDLYPTVLDNIYSEYKDSAENKNIEFLLTKKTESAKVNADEFSVKQIFSHLIDNAIKFTSDGKVEILVEKDAAENLTVQIIDTGIGISKDFAETKMFNPFSKEENGYTRSFEGNGLGLALVKKYCELNNSKIDVISTKGNGTTVVISFPRC